MITVRKVKTFMGMDTRGFNCDLLIDGKFVAQVVQDGSGGPTHYHWATKEAEKESMDYAKALPVPDWMKPSKDFPEGIEDETGSSRLDCAVEDAINHQDIEKKLKRACKSKTVFLLPNESINEGWRTLNIPWGPEAKKYLDKKFPEAKVLNEVYA